MITKANRFINIIFILSILIINSSCVDEYWPDLNEKYNNIMVVDGMITNKPGPYTIKLSSSSTLNFRPENNPLTNHQVSIMDDQGNAESLIEIENGTYITSESGIQGVFGRKYKLIIQTPSGEVYESDYSKLNAPVEIKSIYSELEYKEYNNVNYNQAGYQFYIDTYKADEDTTYLLWRLSETYKYNVDYLIRWKYDHRVLTRLYNSDTLYTCWKTKKINQIFIFNTGILSEPQIERYPFHYRSTATRHLSVRYSLLVQQLTVNEGLYNFWNNLKEINEQDGMFTKQPFQIQGNIKNVNNTNEVVLGYFIVAGISERRIFMDRPSGVEFNYMKCVLGVGDYEAMEWLFMTPSNMWPLYVTEDAEHNKAFPHQDCIDCTRNDGFLEKPEFWVD